MFINKVHLVSWIEVNTISFPPGEYGRKAENQIARRSHEIAVEHDA